MNECNERQWTEIQWNIKITWNIMMEEMQWKEKSTFKLCNSMACNEMNEITRLWSYMTGNHEMNWLGLQIIKWVEMKGAVGCWPWVIGEQTGWWNRIEVKEILNGRDPMKWENTLTWTETTWSNDMVWKFMMWHKDTRTQIQWHCTLKWHETKWNDVIIK